MKPSKAEKLVSTPAAQRGNTSVSQNVLTVCSFGNLLQLCNILHQIKRSQQELDQDTVQTCREQGQVDNCRRTSGLLVSGQTRGQHRQQHNTGSNTGNNTTQTATQHRQQHHTEKSTTHTTEITQRHTRSKKLVQHNNKNRSSMIRATQQWWNHGNTIYTKQTHNSGTQSHQGNYSNATGSTAETPDGILSLCFCSSSCPATENTELLQQS